jgi:hypothetical protein
MHGAKVYTAWSQLSSTCVPHRASVLCSSQLHVRASTVAISCWLNTMLLLNSIGAAPSANQPKPLLQTAPRNCCCHVQDLNMMVYRTKTRRFSTIDLVGGERCPHGVDCRCTRQHCRCRPWPGQAGPQLPATNLESAQAWSEPHHSCSRDATMASVMMPTQLCPLRLPLGAPMVVHAALCTYL